MLKLILRLSLLSGLTLASWIGIVLFVNTYGNPARYYAAIIDKHTLLRTTRAPKIILVGGSNVAVSLDGAQIERAIGMPVVNMGVHGGLGLRFMLNEVAPFVQPGDLVVLVPEYHQFFGLINGDEALVDVVCLFPEALQYLSFPRQYLSLWIRIPTAIQGQFKGYLSAGAWVHPVYNRYAFDRNGDLVSHLNAPPNLEFADKPFFGKRQTTFDPETVRLLNEFAARAQSAGARVVLDFPAIPEHQYKNNAAQLDLVEQHLRNATTIPILATPSAHLFPLEFFYDSPYHLNARGRQAHTAQLIAELIRAPH